MDAVYSKLEKAEISSISDQSSDEIETLLSGDDRHGILREPRRRWATYLHWIVHFFSSVLLVVLLARTPIASDLDRSQCYKLFHLWSPVSDKVPALPYVQQRFNGSLWYRSAFKGPPSDETAKAWAEAIEYGIFSLTEDEIKQLHELSQSPDVSPEVSARYPPDVDDGYIATTVGAHQMHCLHYIWQDHYFDDFPEMQAKKHDVPGLYELHYEHCVDLIRQSLQCNYDPTIITYNWVRDLQNPTPNANVPHTCVDMGPVNEWLSSRQVDVPDGFKWHQPANAYSMPHHPS